MSSEEFLIEFVAQDGSANIPRTEIKAIDAQAIKANVRKLANLVQQFALEPDQTGELELDEVSVSVKITEKGEVVLLSGQTTGMMTLHFRRSAKGNQGKIAPVAQKAPNYISKIGVDYSNLQHLLAAGKWQEANQETWNVMCQALHKAKGTHLSPEDINKIPCQDFSMIDRLWQEYSQGRFGFSVQNRLYKDSISG
ncbi:GUN4 domain-containing protein [Tumidithrix elongata RA019]|uniref:GUN4 domain-containing protein n=1 Tax=Tumidithrix elongata BACA0141 TaxID=2716417 RepID=A0AAW9PXM8_9CYAN|nr:GUN4 domain-containing protein [Tumidithrix elongata RA019]